MKLAEKMDSTNSTSELLESDGIRMVLTIPSVEEPVEDAVQVDTSVIISDEAPAIPVATNVSCLHCQQQFTSRGINRHLLHCRLRAALVSQPQTITTPTDPVEHAEINMESSRISSSQEVTATISENNVSDEPPPSLDPWESQILLLSNTSLQANLPPFERIPKAPIPSYNNIGGTEFMGIIERIYSSVIQ